MKVSNYNLSSVNQKAIDISELLPDVALVGSGLSVKKNKMGFLFRPTRSKKLLSSDKGPAERIWKSVLELLSLKIFNQL